MAAKNIWYVHPYAGGPSIGRYSRPYSLCKNWREQGLQATVFTAAYHHLQDLPCKVGSRCVNGVPYEFVPASYYRGNGFGRLRNMAEMTWNLNRRAEHYVSLYGKPDMVVTSSPHPYVFLATHRLARRYGAKSVFEVRDLWPLSFVELADVSPQHPLVIATGWLERYAYRNADAVVSLLPLTEPYMIKHGLRAGKWHYIPNGVDIADVAESEGSHESLPQILRWQEAGFVVVAYTGALGAPNYVESLVNALEALGKRADVRVAAVIVGRGEKQSALREQICSLGLQDQVKVYDQAPKKEILALLDAVDIGYISLRPEPIFRFGVSPNKLFDYMQAKLPIVFAVQSGNNPVSEAGCGISANPSNPHEVASALLRIAQLSSVERSEMGENGRSYVLSKHAYRVLASRYLDFL